MTTEQESPRNLPDTNPTAPNHLRRDQRQVLDVETENDIDIDTPRLRHTHATAGYRDGIAAAKAAHAQSGFDEGYAVGAELALAVGAVRGALAGLCAGAGADVDGVLAEVCRRAEAELAVQRVFGEEFFAPDGTWMWTVERGDGDGKDDGVTLADVAWRHPLVRKWREVVKELGLWVDG